MYGPIFQLVRTASRDYKVPNTNLTIRKGTLTMIPTYAIHNDAEIYPEPLKFDPERFNDENKRNRHPMAFLPFGDGPRAVSFPRNLKIIIYSHYLFSNFSALDYDLDSCRPKLHLSSFSQNSSFLLLQVRKLR